MEALRVGSRLCECIEGDITSQDTDAIVNAANNHLWMGSGVAGAIKRRGGSCIEEEAVRQGPVAIGAAIVTSAGDLPARYVIHAAVMGQNLVTDAATIRAATRNSLALAEGMGLRSIAFPALGTGVGGFPVRECASIMLHEANSCLETCSRLELVRFVLWGTESAGIFESELRCLKATEAG